MSIMNFLTSILNKVKGVKSKIEELKLNVEVFCAEHRETIATLMKLWNKLYAGKKGSEKMESTIKVIGNCVGLSKVTDEYADEATKFIEEKCQEIYDDLVKEV